MMVRLPYPPRRRGGAFNALNAGLATLALAACASDGPEDIPVGTAPPPLPQADVVIPKPDPVYVCDGGARAQVRGEQAFVIDGEDTLRMSAVPTTSGERYEGPDGDAFRVGGGRATLVRAGQAAQACALGAASVTTPTLPLTASGQEPQWTLRITPRSMTFDTDDGTRVLPTQTPTVRGGVTVWSARDAAGPVEVTISPRVCRGIGVLPRPFVAALTTDRAYYGGCAGPVADLLVGEWMGVGENTALVFGANGSVSGTTGCNAVSGSYRLSDADLTIGPLSTTRRACPGAAAAREQRFLRTVGQIRRFELEADGDIVLIGPEAEVTMRRSTR